MSNTFLAGMRNAIKYWWVYLLTGILFILLGIWVFRTPVESYVALSILFTLTFLVNGVAEIFYALSNRKTQKGWGWILSGGIVDLLIAIMLLSNPAISMQVLPFYVGFALLFRSFSATALALDLQSLGVSSWGFLLLLGVLGIVLSFVLLWNPLVAGMTIVFWTAMAFIIIGIFRIMLSLKLRRLHEIGHAVLHS
jgi:uncharacterized membrane protein HdeD (DUF308 family)